MFPGTRMSVGSINPLNSAIYIGRLYTFIVTLYNLFKSRKIQLLRVVVYDSYLDVSVMSPPIAK